MHGYDFVNSSLFTVFLYFPLLNRRELNMKLCKTSVFCSVLHSTQQHLSRLAGMAISAGLLGGGLIPMAFAEDEKR